MKKKRVLIVDDEMDMRIFITTLLETSGYAPVATRDGEQGFDKAKEMVPDLIILDVMMPGEGGVQMYNNLKADPGLKKVPIVMLSAIARKTFGHYLKMLEARATVPLPKPEAYLEKPPDANELLKITTQLIGPGQI